MKFLTSLTILVASALVLASAPQAKSYGSRSSSRASTPSYGTGSSSRSSSVKGHTRKDGAYVAPHARSKPDKAVNNNWSTKGNTNPRTGEAGTKRGNPYGR